MFKRAVELTVQSGKRIVIAIVGTTVLLIGVVMLIAPGPAIVAIPAGLAILGLEFAWARRWLQTLREKIRCKNAKTRSEEIEGHRKK